MVFPVRMPWAISIFLGLFVLMMARAGVAGPDPRLHSVLYGPRLALSSSFLQQSYSAGVSHRFDNSPQLDEGVVNDRAGYILQTIKNFYPELASEKEEHLVAELNKTEIRVPWVVTKYGKIVSDFQPQTQDQEMVDRLYASWSWFKGKSGDEILNLLPREEAASLTADLQGGPLARQRFSAARLILDRERFRQLLIFFSGAGSTAKRIIFGSLYFSYWLVGNDLFSEQRLSRLRQLTNLQLALLEKSLQRDMEHDLTAWGVDAKQVNHLVQNTVYLRQYDLSQQETLVLNSMSRWDAFFRGLVSDVSNGQSAQYVLKAAIPNYIFFSLNLSGVERGHIAIERLKSKDGLAEYWSLDEVVIPPDLIESHSVLGNHRTILHSILVGLQKLALQDNALLVVPRFDFAQPSWVERFSGFKVFHKMNQITLAPHSSPQKTQVMSYFDSTAGRRDLRYFGSSFFGPFSTGIQIASQQANDSVDLFAPLPELNARELMLFLRLSHGDVFDKRFYPDAGESDEERRIRLHARISSEKIAALGLFRSILRGKEGSSRVEVSMPESISPGLVLPFVPRVPSAPPLLIEPSQTSQAVVTFRPRNHRRDGLYGDVMVRLKNYFPTIMDVNSYLEAGADPRHSVWRDTFALLELLPLVRKPDQMIQIWMAISNRPKGLGLLPILDSVVVPILKDLIQGQKNWTSYLRQLVDIAPDLSTRLYLMHSFVGHLADRRDIRFFFQLIADQSVTFLPSEDEKLRTSSLKKRLIHQFFHAVPSSSASRGNKLGNALSVGPYGHQSEKNPLATFREISEFLDSSERLFFLQKARVYLLVPEDFLKIVGSIPMETLDVTGKQELIGQILLGLNFMTMFSGEVFDSAGNLRKSLPSLQAVVEILRSYPSVQVLTMIQNLEQTKAAADQKMLRNRFTSILLKLLLKQRPESFFPINTSDITAHDYVKALSPFAITKVSYQSLLSGAFPYVRNWNDFLRVLEFTRASVRQFDLSHEIDNFFDRRLISQGEFLSREEGEAFYSVPEREIAWRLKTTMILRAPDWRSSLALINGKPVAKVPAEISQLQRLAAQWIVQRDSRALAGEIAQIQKDLLGHAFLDKRTVNDLVQILRTPVSQGMSKCFNLSPR